MTDRLIVAVTGRASHGFSLARILLPERDFLMINSIRTLAAVVVIAALSLGQEMTVTISPNPAPVGQPITITVQAAHTNLYTPNGCLLSDIRIGTPTGPSCAVFACTFVPVAIPLYGSPTSRQFVWNQNVLPSAIPGGMATPGVYYLKITYQVGGGIVPPAGSEYFPVTIDNPANPTPALAALNTPHFGMPFQMGLSAGIPHGGEPYAVALSFTSNTGIPISGAHVSLDNDSLFALSLAADPNLFLNFSGVLDSIGSTFQPIQILIPAVAGILVVPIHAQAVVVGPGGVLTLSNDLTIHIH
jgi:hypothetical protein